MWPSAQLAPNLRAGVTHAPCAPQVIHVQRDHLSHALQQRRHLLHPPSAAGPGASGGSDAGSDDESVDIDQLATQLSRQAERMRQSQSSGSEYASDDSLDPSPGTGSAQSTAGSDSGASDGDMLSPLGYSSNGQEGDILAEVGDGGFYASEFELLQELGQISIQQVAAAAEGGLFTGGGERRAAAAVIAYAATFYSGMPFQDPVGAMLKEYLPGARAVACNELQVLKHLGGMPGAEDKWRRATAPLSQNPPIVELLGYFFAGPSPRARQLLAGPAAGMDTIWIVQRWDGMAPLSLYPSSQQTSGMGLGRLFGGAAAAQRERERMVRAIAGGALRALAYCHRRNVVHGALGAGSFLLSTFDDASSTRLVIKLDNFGFARHVQVAQTGGFRPASGGGTSAAGQPADDDTPLALGQRADLRQLAVVLLECVLSALASSGASEHTSAEAVQRVLGEVFGWDVEQYRRYCRDEPSWEAAAELLEADGGAGWRLLADLLYGGVTADEVLSTSTFCAL